MLATEVTFSPLKWAGIWGLHRIKGRGLVENQTWNTGEHQASGGPRAGSQISPGPSWMGSSDWPTRVMCPLDQQRTLGRRSPISALGMALGRHCIPSVHHTVGESSISGRGLGCPSAKIPINGYSYGRIWRSCKMEVIIRECQSHTGV